MTLGEAVPGCLRPRGTCAMHEPAWPKPGLLLSRPGYTAVRGQPSSWSLRSPGTGGQRVPGVVLEVDRLQPADFSR